MVLLRNVSDLPVFVELASGDKPPSMKRINPKGSDVVACPTDGVCTMKVYGDGSRELWTGYVPVDNETLYIDGGKNIVFIMNDENPTIIPQSIPEKGELQEILDSIDSTIETYKPEGGGTCNLTKRRENVENASPSNGVYEWIKIFLIIMAVMALMWYVYRYHLQKKK
jgi:hypothetical protein